MTNFDDLKPKKGLERKREIPEAGLEQTLEDHLAIGSTPLKVLEDNPGKTLAETMDDAALKEFIMEQVAAVRVSHSAALSGDPVDIKIFKIQFEQFLAPNILYLRKIGRLPSGLADLDLVKEFSLPIK